MYIKLAPLGGAHKLLSSPLCGDVITPIKKIKDTFQFKGGDTFSQWVSSVREPIESLFNPDTRENKNTKCLQK